MDARTNTVVVVSLLVIVAITVIAIVVMSCRGGGGGNKKKAAPVAPAPMMSTPTPCSPCHKLCVDSLCPSLSQYYEPLVGRCVDRPAMNYGFSMAGGACEQRCLAEGGGVEADGRQFLCDRYGDKLYATGVCNGLESGTLPCDKPPLIPANLFGQEL